MKLITEQSQDYHLSCSNPAPFLLTFGNRNTGKGRVLEAVLLTGGGVSGMGAGLGRGGGASAAPAEVLKKIPVSQSAAVRRNTLISSNCRCNGILSNQTLEHLIKDTDRQLRSETHVWLSCLRPRLHLLPSCR